MVFGLDRAAAASQTVWVEAAYSYKWVIFSEIVYLTVYFKLKLGSTRVNMTQLHLIVAQFHF